MLRSGTVFREYTLNVCSNFGGLGDMIARCPTFRYMHDNYPHLRMTIYWHDYFVDLARALLPETDRMRHKKLSEMAWADDRVPLLDFSPTHLSSFSMHMTEHAFLMMVNRIPTEDKDLWYLQFRASATASKLYEIINKRSLSGYKGYIGITLGFTAPARAWPNGEVEKVVNWCVSNGYKPVLLGSTGKAEVGNGNGIEAKFDLKGISIDKCVNLIDQTTLIEAVGVIQELAAIVGVDNGLLHLASCTTTPVVWGFTSLSPEHRLPYLPSKHKHSVVVPEGLSCAGCQSKAYFVRHEFKYCMYKDYACTKLMKGEKFVDALVELGL